MKELSLFETDEPNCHRCGLINGSKTPKMKYSGNGNKEVLIIGNAPGKTEDEYGIQLMGKSGQFLRSHFQRYGFNIDTDAWKINAINCRTKGGVLPTNDQIECCFPYVKSVIKELKPKFIWTFGSAALHSLQENCFGKVVMAEWDGLVIYDHTWDCYVLPMISPTDVLREEKNLNLKAMYQAQLYNACSQLNREPVSKLNYNIHHLINYDDIIQCLKKVFTEELIYFDYETTGLKPFKPGHKIVSIAYTTDGINAYSFPLEYRKHFDSQQINEIKSWWVKILNDNNILKAAHNIKYEDNWSRHLLKSNEINWYWDSMITAHVLDPRRKFSGLKRQAYINFGDRPYDDHIQSYLKSENSHTLNNVNKIPIKDLLEYNGLDVIYGFNLMKKQEIQLEKDGKLKQANDLFLKGIMAFSDMQLNGICANEQFYYDKEKEITAQIKKIEIELMKSNEAELFVQKIGYDLNFESTKDIGILLYDVLKLKPVFTEKGNYKADKNVVAEIDIPFTKKLLEKRKLEKVKGTYISQMSREICNGKINAFFDLHVPVSYRSSASAPSFQNFPKRDKEAQMYIRGGIIPSPGNKILECDYSGVEVRVSCCTHKDQNMIKYVCDPTTDMHRDTAANIFKLSPDLVTKELRFYAKNMWVFAEFYGDYYGNCARNIWKTCLDLHLDSGITVSDHFRSVGIKTYDQFETHCKEVENIFWNERFKEYNQWKNEIEMEYRKYGYVRLHTGFKCSGNLGRNQITNFPIQGPAFHCLLWSFIEVNKIAKQEKWKSKLIAEIHDSMIFDLFPPEQDHIIETVKDVGTVKIREVFPWIIVPLTIDFEVTEIDQAWVYAKGVK